MGLKNWEFLGNPQSLMGHFLQNVLVEALVRYLRLFNQLYQMGQFRQHINI